MEDSGHCTYNCKLICLTLYSTLPPSNKEGEKERKGEGKEREGVRGKQKQDMEASREALGSPHSPGHCTWGEELI